MQFSNKVINKKFYLFLAVAVSIASVALNVCVAPTNTFAARSASYLQPTVALPFTKDIGEINEYIFPKLNETTLPQNFATPLSDLKRDYPMPYLDECHVQQNLIATNTTCIYGDISSSTKVVLFGDSHALSWFPALNKIALAQHWKLYSFTMSSCWPALIPAWNSVTHILMQNCSAWRTYTIKKIRRMSPYLTIVTGTKGFATINAKGVLLNGDSRTATWVKGMNTTLKLINEYSVNTILLSDYPTPKTSIPECLMHETKTINYCATPSASALSTKWLNIERKVALVNNVYWINPTEWICSTEPCSPLKNSMVEYRDGGHLATIFSKSLALPLWNALNQILEDQSDS